MIDLKTIQSEWKTDSKIDDLLLDETSMKIPCLHQKYLEYRSDISLTLKRKQQELKFIKHKKSLYYLGKADPDEYLLKPFPHKVLKTDLGDWIGVDEEYCKVELEVEYYTSALHTCDEILKQIHQISFNIKNTIAWRQFVSGA